MPDVVTYNLLRTRDVLADCAAVQQRFGVDTADEAKQRIHLFTLRTIDIPEDELTWQAPFILVSWMEIRSEAYAGGAGTVFVDSGKLWLYYRDNVAGDSLAALLAFAEWVGAIHDALRVAAGAGDLPPFTELVTGNMKRNGPVAVNRGEWMSADTVASWKP